MPSTVILEPLNDDDDKKHAEKIFMKVATLMHEMNNVDIMRFFDFLKELEMDLHTFLLVVRSSLSSPKIFLKHLPCETRVNNYNTVALNFFGSKHVYSIYI